MRSLLRFEARLVALLLCFSTICFFNLSLSAQTREEAASFLPVWKLLNNEGKQQFISGYMHGWKDAERVNSIALSYIKENPQKAVEGLEKIQSLYDLKDISVETMIRALDAFYSSPDNQKASLSQAVNAVKGAIN